MVDSIASRRATVNSVLRSMVFRPFSLNASITFQMSTKWTVKRQNTNARTRFPFSHVFLETQDNPNQTSDRGHHTILTIAFLLNESEFGSSSIRGQSYGIQLLRPCRKNTLIVKGNMTDSNTGMLLRIDCAELLGEKCCS